MVEMEKFDCVKHSELMSELSFSYISTKIYLDFCAWVLCVNGEDLIVKQDEVYKHDFPSLFLPKNIKNFEYMTASMINEHDIKKIINSGIEVIINKTETEFIYLTENIINPSGGHKRQINKFKKNDYKIYNVYERGKILRFNDEWRTQKKVNNVFIEESNNFFGFCLDNLDKYDVKQIYVEVDNKLIGFGWGVKHSKDEWVNLHIKCDYGYKGLSQFLNCELAKMFCDVKICSLGTGCQNTGLIKYKTELNPIKQNKYYYVLTRGKNEM